MTGTVPLAPEVDLIIVGSGGGSMCAALVAKSLGKTAVILEKEARVGGSTSYSGGVWWVPNNPLLAASGIDDSLDKAREYLTRIVTYQGPAVTRERTDAFLKAAPEMLRFLQRLGLKIRRPIDPWPDYYDELSGGLAQGRSVLPEPFNLMELGEWKDRLATYPPMGSLPIGSDEFTSLFLTKRTLKGKIKAMKFAWGLLRDRLLKRQTVTNGGAIQGRMLQIALREKVQLHRSTAVLDLILEAGRVVGVRAIHAGREVEIRARDGVLVNAGGYSRNAEFRRRFGRAPSSIEWTSANPGDTGEMVEAMMRLGAATDCLDTAWWVITSRGTDGCWPQGAQLPDGRVFPFMHHLDLSLPYSIVVDQDGRRFADESGAYMEIGERMYEREQQTGRAIPSWTIMDRRQREYYPWGVTPPGKTPQQWLDSGYMKKADTLEKLAIACNIDPAGLEAEVARYNGFCETGVDLDFGSGGRVFDRAHGDPSVKPNPNLGAIKEGPFYAVAMYPGDVGTAGGVVTDEYARVRRSDGSRIPGLYAVGNCTASPFGRCYPGAGASIAPSFTFGFIAAHHSAGSSELTRLLA
jgi:3-oxosteroid 1-dehydrogenase